MKNLVEQYISQSPGSQAQVDAARKAFKAELRNGPVKSVIYANGISGQKAYGNFDLQLYHQAYDAELDAQGLLIHFDDQGLVNRNSYQAFKAATGEGAKYAKELWVLQYSQSSYYKLVNAPAAAAPMSTADLILKLLGDEQFKQIFQYSVADITFTREDGFNNCQDVFNSWFGTTDKMDSFLAATFLKDKPYEIVKKNICAMFLCMVASQQVLRQARAQNRLFQTENNMLMTMDNIVVDYETKYKVPVRLGFIFKHTSPDFGVHYKYLRVAFRFRLDENDKLLDMPVYAGVCRSMISASSISTIWLRDELVDTPEITKFSDINFKMLEQIFAKYMHLGLYK